LLVLAGVARLASRIPGRSTRTAVRIVRRHARWPARLLVAAVALHVALPALGLDDDPAGRIRHAALLAIIGAIGWLAIALVGAATEILSERLDLTVRDNLRARRAQTQAVIARRVSAVVIGVVTAAAML